MPLRYVQIAVAADSSLPRDYIVNGFYLNEEGPAGGDYDQLAQDAGTLWNTWYLGTRDIWARVYDVGTPPNYPIGEHRRNAGQAPVTNGAREVACCLSFYGARNLPSTRGRIFFGVAAAGRGISDVRPPSSLRTPLLAMADGIAALGGVDMDWSVYSRLHGTHENVQNAYVDDEWDVVRSRGLRPTARTSKAITE